MADGFDIHVNADLAERLQAVADGSGLSAEQLALEVLGQVAGDDWAEDFRRLEEYDRTGVSIPKDEWMAGLRESVAAFQRK
jgi:predicted signal transduction protein with EAL and GGDEF domain